MSTRWRVHAALALALAIGVGAAGRSSVGASTRQTSDPQLTFRSGVDVVAVDVTVLDRNGLPVLDLEPDDFVVRVDGQPREVVSARLLQFAPPRRTPGPRPEFGSPFSTNRPMSAGRAVLIVVDAGSFAAMEPKPALDAAVRFVDQLAPEDRLALAVVPGFGKAIDFTSDHAAIRRALREALGNAWDMGAHRQFQSRDLRMGKTEALAWDRGNRGVINDVTQRECGSLDSAECFEQLSLLATQLSAEVRSSADRRLAAIGRLLDDMALLPGPKWMILVSAGVAFEFESLTPSRFAEAAARGQTTIHAVFVDTATIDPFGNVAPSSFRQDREFERAGLENIVGFARGVVHRVVANSAPAFDRIANEISALWELGVAPRPADLDGRGHRLDVQVKRPGVTVRARPQFVADPGARARSRDGWIDSAMRTPAALSALPLKVATYTLRDGGSNHARVLISAEIGFDRGTTHDAWLAYEAREPSGRVAGSGLTRVSRTDPARPGVVHYVGALTLPQGHYTLRFAALDQDGRLGNVDHPLSATFRPVGGVRVSDLLVGEARAQASAENVPAEPVVHGAALDAYLEVYAAEKALPSELEYRFDLVAPGDARPLVSADATAVPLADGAGRAVTGRVKIGHLPAGDYEVHARLVRGGTTVAGVSRPVRLVRAAAIPVPVVALPRLPSTLPSLVPAFDARSALSSDVLADVLRPLEARPTATNPLVRESLDRAREGRHVSSSDEAALSTGDPVMAQVLRGLGLAAEGRCEAATPRLRAALGREPDLWAAAFLLGVCEAARGRDREAAGAWRTTLAQGGDAVAVTYELAADALLRLDRPQEAAALLDEALEKWPASPAVVRRAAVALAMSGRARDALVLLDGQVARAPDADLALVGIRLLVAAAEDGQPLLSAEEDGAALARLARAYVVAGGPLSGDLGRWLDTIER